MTAKLLVSFLIPVFNGERHIGNALESVLAQDYSNFEVIVVDDGSTDGTAGILQGFKRHSGFKIVTNRKNQGIVGALNRGLTHCTGDLVARLDADDITSPDRLSVQVDLFDGNPSLVLSAGAYERVSPTGKRIKIGAPPMSHGAMFVALLGSNRINHSTATFRRSIAHALGGYRAEWSLVEDYDLWLRLLRVGSYAGTDKLIARTVNDPAGLSLTSSTRQATLMESRRRQEVTSLANEYGKGSTDPLRLLSTAIVAAAADTRRRQLPSKGAETQIRRELARAAAGQSRWRRQYEVIRTLTRVRANALAAAVKG